MPWLEEAELQRVVALDVDARYAYAVDTIRERGELWTLRHDGGWVTSAANDVSLIPIWPHERFALLEANDSWLGAVPDRISLDDWLADTRATWFAEHEAQVEVFLVGVSATHVKYSMFADHLRGDLQDRYRGGVRWSGRSPQRKRATREPGDLVNFVTAREIEVVLQRVPKELRTRVRDTFQNRSSDASVLGYVSTRGRRDINLSSRLPIRVSLGPLTDEQLGFLTRVMKIARMSL